MARKLPPPGKGRVKGAVNLFAKPMKVPVPKILQAMRTMLSEYPVASESEEVRLQRAAYNENRMGWFREYRKLEAMLAETECKMALLCFKERKQLRDSAKEKRDKAKAAAGSNAGRGAGAQPAVAEDNPLEDLIGDLTRE